MNTKVIGIIVVIAVIAAGVWYFTQNNTDSTQTKDASVTTDTEAQLEQENTSLKELMTRGRDVKCTYQSAEDGKGTIYATKGNARVDFEVTTEGKTSIGHMIANENTGYFWMEGETTGMKMMMNTETESNTTNNQGVDPNKNYEFSCDSWRADSSVFTPPAAVQFQEFTIPAVPAASTSTEMKIDPTAICNSLDEPAKSQCLSSMKKQ